MSFQLLCSACGAPSSPSVGVCPFCKVVLSSSAGDEPATLKHIRMLFDQGQLEAALASAGAAERGGLRLVADAGFLLTYAKILFEAQGPSSKIRALLAKAQITKPDSPEIIDYFELIEAKGHFSRGAKEFGETALRRILSRSPRNAHALFTLASYLHREGDRSEETARLLRLCVDIRPAFLRAWACLAAVLAERGDGGLAQEALQKCLKLERNPAMHAYFEKLAKAA